MAVASLAVLIGTAENVSAMRSLAELAEHFDPAQISKSASKFDPADLTALNRSLIHAMPFEQVRERLAALGITGDEAPKRSGWPCAATSTASPMRSCGGVSSRKGRIDEPHLGRRPRVPAALLRPAAGGAVERSTWKTWTEAVKEATGRKGKALFMPIRLALPGCHRGRSSQIYCPCWVGKEHWPDDPDPAFGGVGLADGRFGLRRQRRRDRVRVHAALGVGERLGIGAGVGPGRGDRDQRLGLFLDGGLGDGGFAGDDLEILRRVAAACRRAAIGPSAL